MGRKSFKSYVCRAAVNLAKNHINSEAKKGSLPLDSATYASVKNKDPQNWEEEVIRKSRNEELRRLLTGLPKDRTELIVYRFVVGLECGVIATEMGRSLSATKTLLHRTIVGLRKEITQHPDQYSLLHESLNESEQNRARKLNTQTY